jgi:galactose mutarotase-like enzyme
MSASKPAWMTLSSAELVVQVDPLGAQLSALRDRNGRELLWPGDPAIWAGRAPLLFPIIGTLANGSYRLGSERYALSRHGFARGRLFDVLDAGDAGAVFRLRPDDAMRAVYPFDFELDMHFSVDGATLSMTAWIRNVGNDILPASFGYHPGFAWPLPFGQARSAHFIEFANDEPAPIRRLDHAGLVTPAPLPTPVVQRRLFLNDALFKDDVIIFDAVRSRSLTYGAAAGPRIRLGFPDTSCLGIWTKPKANFICIEPWHGMSDPQEYSGDFRAKPGVFQIAPGGAKAITMTITLLTG